jgi:hypothetical protein
MLQMNTNCIILWSLDSCEPRIHHGSICLSFLIVFQNIIFLTCLILKAVYCKGQVGEFSIDLLNPNL